MQTITDTMPAEIIESVGRYYARKGYAVKSMTLMSANRWEIVYEWVAA